MLCFQTSPEFNYPGSCLVSPAECPAALTLAISVGFRSAVLSEADGMPLFFTRSARTKLRQLKRIFHQRFFQRGGNRSTKECLSVSWKLIFLLVCAACIYVLYTLLS